MSDSPPPPAYSQIEDDPFADHPSPLAHTQPAHPHWYSALQNIDPRARYGYGPEIVAPEDLVEPYGAPVTGKFYVVPICPVPCIVDDWCLVSDLIFNVPGGTNKGHKTWQGAVAHYTRLYNTGGLKVVHPRDPTSTPGRSVSTPLVVHSAAPTPTAGDRIHPLFITSSPAPTPHTPSRAPHTPSRGTCSQPIFIASSPVTTPAHATAQTARHNNTPATPTQNAATKKRHEYVNKQFAKLSAARATAPSAPTPTAAPASEGTPSKSTITVPGSSKAQDAGWRDPTPVSIPGAKIYSSAAPTSTQDGRDPTSTQDGRDTTSNAPDEDDEYFKHFPMSSEELAALAELDEVLAEPRFA